MTNLMKERLILDNDVRLESIMVRKAWLVRWRQLVTLYLPSENRGMNDTAGHIESTIRRQSVMSVVAELCFSFLCTSGFKPWIGANLIYSGSSHPS